MDTSFYGMKKNTNRGPMMAGTRTTEIMEEIIQEFQKVVDEWDKQKARHSLAGEQRIRVALDKVARQKVDLRRAMKDESVRG